MRKLIAFVLILLPMHATLAVEPPVPLPTICGFAVFKICGASRGNRFAPEWVAVSPTVITTITNPPESPNGCVKIFSMTGRGIYVLGDEIDAARLLRNAERERREELCN